MKQFLISIALALSIFSSLVFAQNELFNKALEQFDAKQYELAAQTFSQVVAQSPEFYQAHFNLGLCHYNLKRYDQAISSFQKSVQLKPDYARANYWLGNALYIQKRYDEAINWYQKTVQYEPNNANAHYRMGLTYQDQKKYSDAEKAFKKAITINPNESDYKTELGNVYVNLKMFPDAIAVFNEAIQLNPVSANAQLGMGNAYYNNNNYVASIPYYKKASELSPNWATAFVYLADAYYKTKQYGQALSAYENAVIFDDSRADVYYGMGLTYIAQNNKPMAQRVLTNLENLDATKANLLRTEINKMGGGTAVTPQPVKTAQRIKDEQDVAKMADFGFDGAVVVQVASVRDLPKATGKVLLAVKRGDILSLVEREDSNNWFRVIDEKTGTEGWIEGKAVVIKLTGNKVTGPPILESGAGASALANPVVVVSNLEEKTTLRLRINGALYQIPPQTTKSLSLPPGKMSYYGWSPGIRATTGSSVLEKGKQYSWSFKINRR